jgi:hypothetical protein
MSLQQQIDANASAANSLSSSGYTDDTDISSATTGFVLDVPS